MDGYMCVYLNVSVCMYVSLLQEYIFYLVKTVVFNHVSTSHN